MTPSTAIGWLLVLLVAVVVIVLLFMLVGRID